MAATTGQALPIMVFVLLASLPSAFLYTPHCVYTIYIKTGSIIKGGTDSIISIKLFDAAQNSLTIKNLVGWGGIMPKGYEYYQRGNLDVFSGLGYCLTTPVCKITLSSDGTGPHHGWYVRDVEVASIGPKVSCSQRVFKVEQWLATDASPYVLNTTRDNCDDEIQPHAAQEPSLATLTLE
ncbi:hypothetical protein O6H91_09G046100 [Diphasiastrum complanatum]|uniref:Uncharacterized protein n=1 Tax=Diphasiastrum complanatum TaxID=34168 RepID=A0ACC2CP32_DIPCM|nr:hypothetical protein O6H91_09G046100 [Diphasiastrum complanatum]